LGSVSLASGIGIESGLDSRWRDDKAYSTHEVYAWMPGALIFFLNGSRSGTVLKAP